MKRIDPESPIRSHHSAPAAFLLASQLFLVTALAIACAAPPGSGESQGETPIAQRPPNVIVILADDLGYGDVCAYGCQGGKTPNIDALAAAGARFTQGYVSAPICSPSRAGLMTGRYQQRFGHEFNAGAERRAQEMGLGTPTTEIMLPQLLRDAGYRTGMVGKWHLGPKEEQHPMSRGFEEFFGFLHGGNLYAEPLEGPGIHYVATMTDSPRDRRSEINPILRGREPVEEPEYLTDAFTREAVDYIERHRDEPFFLYLAYNAPHTPLQITDEYYDRFPHIEDEAKRIFAAMVSSVDDGVGEIVAKLRETGLEENTLIVFLSDNGCATYTGACHNDPLLGGKITPFEGGFRVPFVAAWEGQIEAGRVIDTPASALDILPTAVEMAGAALPDDRPIDGRSLLALLRGESDALDREAFFWRNGTNWAVVRPPFKLVDLNGKYELLFDLSQDIAEEHDLSRERPELVEELTALYRRWSAETVQPLWETRGKVHVELDSILERKEKMVPLREPGEGTVEFYI